MNEDPRWLVPVLAMWALIPVALGGWMAVDAVLMWWPAFHVEDPPWHGRPLLSFILLLPFAPVALALGAVSVAIWLDRQPQPRSGAIAAPVLVAMTSLTPSAVRLILPSEDPYTGAGFPGAALIGSVVLAIACTLVFGLPAVILALGRSWSATTQPTQP